MVGPYRGRPDPVTIVPTAERVAVAVATAALKRELRPDEHLIAVSLGDYFGRENDTLSRERAELVAQVEQLQKLLMEIYRESA